MRIVRVYGRVLGLLYADRLVAAVLCVANLLLAGLQFMDPLLFGRVIDLLARAETLTRTDLWNHAVVLLGLWAGVGIAGILANIAVALQADRVAHRNRLAVMSRYFAHVLSLPLSFHGEVHSGRLMKTMLNGADSLFGQWLSVFRDQLSTVIAVVVLLPLTLFMNWHLALVLMLLVALFCGLTLAVIRHTEGAQQEVERFHSALAGAAQDAMSNVMVVQSFTRLSAESRIFRRIARQVITRQFPVLTWWAVVTVLTRAASTVAVITIVIVGAILLLQGRAEVGEIVAFIGFANLLIGRLESLMSFASRVFMQLPAIEEFFAVLDTRSSVPDQPGARALVAGRGEVVFDAVRFGYPAGAEILTGLSFTARPGSSVALVGTTGAGKSTAMALLQRQWDPTAGRITVDGQDLREVTLDSLRRAIGVVFQDSLLFNRSIRDNLLIGRPDATQAQLEAACRLAEAHDFILRQPQGYDTMVGERGVTLSGGQRQRLAIARAALKDPPILILDEATSALDAATEARVGRALAKLMAGRTTFIIAHRLSTVRDADEILVFEAGRIVERGNFDTLLRRDGRFAELVATQLSGPAPIPA